ncbi:MAG: EpsG family protein [Sphingomicrobium sp.]
MLPYWILFAYFAAGALAGPVRPDSTRRQSHTFLLLGLLLTALMIGTRFNVGGDWRSYMYMFSYVGHVSLERALEIGDPGYQFINWTVQQWKGEIWWVNLVCGAIFTWGLARLCLIQPKPWLAVLVAVPYMITVVAMGYTRQAVALGILMAGLASLGRGGSVIRFAVYVAAAALFHKTAVLVLPLVIFAGKRNRVLNVIAGIALFVLFFDLFLSDSTDQFVKAYVEARYSSQGAWIRVVLVLVPALLLLAKRGRFGLTEQEEKVWRYIAFTACTLPVILILTPSSTAVDRMALYLMPLQIVVLSRAYLLFRKPRFGIAAVVLYALAVQFTWLNFAQHAKLWIPYRSNLLEDTSDKGNERHDRR